MPPASGNLSATAANASRAEVIRPPLPYPPDLPPVGRHTKVLLAQPFLNDTMLALEACGAVRLDAMFPFGAEGTTDWLHAAARAWGVDESRFQAVIAPGVAGGLIHLLLVLALAAIVWHFVSGRKTT